MHETDQTASPYRKLRVLMESSGVPDLGPGPREGVGNEKALSRQVTEAISGASLRPEAEALMRSLVLLWHDHLEASHVISQQVDSVDGSYVHGLMHRREPDYGNAKYWFRRVGVHECFKALASRAVALLTRAGKEEWISRLAAGGRWDPMAMVDLCELLEGREDGDRERVLAREIQALEFDVLLEFLCS